MQEPNTAVESPGDSIFSMRFYGGALGESTMPIYELGQILVSTQRIIHKSYQAHQDLQFSGRLSPEERNRLALQISNSRKGSHIVDLIPYLTQDPFLSQVIAEVTATVLVVSISTMFKAINSYVRRNAVEEVSNSNNPQQSLVYNIYGDMTVIGDQINRANGFDGFNFLPNQQQFPETADILNIDQRTRDYIKGLEGLKVRGNNEIEIVGEIHKFNENTKDITLNVGGGKVRVTFDRLAQDRYIDLRQEAGPNATVRCSGNYVSEFGKQRPIFEATSIYVYSPEQKNTAKLDLNL